MLPVFSGALSGKGRRGFLLLRVSSVQLAQLQAQPWGCREARTAEAGRGQGCLGLPFGSIVKRLWDVLTAGTERE